MRRSSYVGASCFSAAAMVAAATACSSPGATPGGGDSAGAAGPRTCRQPLGSVVVVASEPSSVQHPDLPPVEPLIGVLARQSNCFLVAARGKAIEEAALREQQLGGADGRGLAAADYALTTAVTFIGRTGESRLDALLGGANGAPGAKPLSKWSGLVNQAAGTSFASDEATVVLTLVDNRSGFEIGAAQGSASASTMNVTGSLGALWNQDSGSGTASSYQKTPEARLVSAAVMDGFGKLVASVEPNLAYRAAAPALGAADAAAGLGPPAPLANDAAPVAGSTAAADVTAVSFEAPAAVPADGGASGGASGE